MGKDISLRMMELALCDAFHCRDLGKDGLQQVVPVQQLQAFRGVGTAENLGELVSNSFGADDLDFGGSFSYGMAGGLLDLERQVGGQADGAEHAQLVLGATLAGISDGADCPWVG